MRCTNCGYDNGAGYSACIKCGQPLQAFNQPSYNSLSQGEGLGGTVIGQQVGKREYEPKPTMILGSNPNFQQGRETVVFPAGRSGGQKTLLISSTVCPNCKYPIVANHLNCPNCGTLLAEQKNSSENKVISTPPIPVMDDTFKCMHCQNKIPRSSRFCSFCGQPVPPPTILPKKPVGPSCFLTMQPEDSEVLEQPKKGYSGESVILNRLNTEENNPTITTQKQAELKFEEGEWYLLNLSEQQTTYLELNRKIQLEDGDIIVLGNRRFKFEKK